jgi:hypothetical protein
VKYTVTDSWVFFCQLLLLLCQLAYSTQLTSGGFRGVRECGRTPHSSPQRNDILRRAVIDADLDGKRQRLRNLCETRWVERHDAILIFKMLFVPMLNALDECVSLRDRETLVKAEHLKAAAT